MELQGKVIVALPERSGTSSRGEWKSQEFVIETHESYPKKMVFNVFGAERLQRFNVKVGQEVNVSFDIDAHEYNNRWFNSINAFDVRLVDVTSNGQAQTASEQAPQAPAAQPASAPEQPQTPASDDLPF